MEKFIRVTLRVKDKKGNPIFVLINVSFIENIVIDDEGLFIVMCNFSRGRKPSGYYVEESFEEICKKIGVRE